jgi:glycosyltransferase involved in cell wall biosynthesis
MSKNLICLKSERPSNPSLAVLVRVKNEGKALREFWNRLSSQTIFVNLEIVFLDSGSTDGSLEFLKQLPITLYQIPSEDFNFGGSCNLLMSVSHAQVVAFLSGHVLLEQTDALETLHAFLAKHESAAAFLRQVPNTLWGATIYEKAYLARRFPLKRGGGAIEVTTPRGFSNAASGLTRTAWQRTPFPEMHGSEDRAWAQQHLQRGGRLFYLSSPFVMHSHVSSSEETFSRVLLNVHALRVKGSYFRAGYYLIGVFTSMLCHGSSLAEAWRYASAHARAYLPKWEEQKINDAK